jgi:hypothetical protein
METLFANPGMKTLLMFDAVVFGQAVAEAMSGSDMTEWVRKHAVTILMPVQTRIYVDRLLAEQGCRAHTPQSIAFANADARTHYTFEDGTQARVSYHSAVATAPPTCVNVDLLATNRQSVYVRDTGVSSVPMHEMLVHVKERTFGLLSHQNTFVNRAVVQKYLDAGWRRVSGVQLLEEHTHDLEEICTICQSNVNAAEFCITPCNHQYHADCWRDFVSNALGEGDHSTFMSSIPKSFVNCPCCRAEISVLDSLL